MVHELDTVVITRDIALRGIVAGDVAVVAHLYRNGSVAEVALHDLDVIWLVVDAAVGATGLRVEVVVVLRLWEL